MIGVEFLEKVSDYKKMMVVGYYREKIKNDSEHVKASEITTKKYELV